MGIRELIEISIKSLRENNSYNECCIFDDDLVKFKRLSIRLINNEEEYFESWIEQLKLLERKSKYSFPIEAFLVVSNEINRNNADELLIVYVDEFSTLLIDRLLKEIHFCIDKKLLHDLVVKIKVNNSVDNRKRILLKKIKRLTLLYIDSIGDSIIGFRIKNFSKLELSSYLYGEFNWYYIPNSDIDIIDIKNGQVVKEVVEDNKLLLINNGYTNLREHLNIHLRDNIILNNQYERMLVYSFIKYYIEVYNKKDANIKVSEDIINNILKYKDLLSDEYKNKILNKSNQKTIQVYINKLENNPTKDGLRDVINMCNDIDWIFEILKFAPKIINDEIPSDIHINAIVKCNSIDRHNIKIALYCEELLENNPIIIEEIVEFLIGMYKEGIFTEATEKVLKYLRCTVRNNKVIDYAEIKVMAEKENLDKDFIEKFVRIYNEADNKSSLDSIVNKIINKNYKKVDEKLYSIIYEFYKRNNDIRALEILCNTIISNRNSLKLIGIINEDIIALLNNFLLLGKYDNKRNIFIMINEFKESKDIILKSVKILEAMGSLEVENIENEYKDIYFDIVSIAKDYNENLKNIYMRMLINKPTTYKYSEVEVVDLLDILDMADLESNESIKIISIVIKYYINNNDNNEALKYFKRYLEELSSIDDGELFREILSSYNNLDFIEVILKEVDFTRIEKVDLLLNITFDRLIENNRYELLIEILRYYNETERYNEGVYVLKGYINNISYIDSLIYEVFILPILRNVNDSTVKEIYDTLISRGDLPIEIREEFYSLNTNKYNTDIIISEFNNYVTESSLAKNLALRKYYDNDIIFEELIIRGINNVKTCEIVFEKVKEKFNENKGFVELIITDDIAQLNDELRQIKEYAIEYTENLFEPEKCNVFGEYIVINRVEGELSDELSLKNIFTEQTINGVIFKDNALYDIYTKYLNNNKIDFNVIDINVITISDNIECILPQQLSLIEILNSFNRLVKMQNLLMSNRVVMLDFTKDSFKLNYRGFILNSFVNIFEYSGEFILRDCSIFENINGIRNKNNKVIINEKNIVKIMCQYIKNILLNEEKVEELTIEDNMLFRESIMKDKFIKYVLGIEINSLEELYNTINLFIDKESKEFEELSYRKQISMFDDLNDEEKIKVISKAIIDRDTTPIIKNKVIYFENIPSDINNNYFIYLINCFNNTLNLNSDDYDYIYDNVTKMLINSEKKFLEGEKNMFEASIDEKVIKDQADELATLYIDSVKKCKYRVKDIEKDISKLSIIDVEYIVSRINKK